MILLKPEKPKAAKNAKKDKPRKGGDGSTGREKAPVPPPASEGPFLPVTYSLDQPLIDRISEWAHSQRLTKSAAARRLFEKGLAA